MFQSLIATILVAIAPAMGTMTSAQGGTRGVQTRPTVPRRLQATTAEARVSLSWNMSRARHSKIVGYRVYRNNRPLARVHRTRYIDTRVLDGKAYRYFVIAYDAAGRRSRPSNKVWVRLPSAGGSGPGTHPTAGPGGASSGGVGGLASPGNGLSTNPAFFPIGVWLQTPASNAQNFADIGVNTFVGQDDGNSPQSLQALRKAGEIAIAPQDSVGLSDPNGTVIKAWQSQPDEPDNAQPDGSGGYGPCISPTTILSEYQHLKALDPASPIYLNFGQGVANTSWVGRGSCTGDTAMYSRYARGADILSFDVYPVNDGYPLSAIATGVDNLRGWAPNKPVFAFVETTGFNGGPGPTAAQIKAETWLALIHGANGIEYFCHIFSPQFIEAGCLTLPSVVTQLKADDAQVASLAPVLNGDTLPQGVTVTSTLRVDTMVKRYSGSIYVFAEAVGQQGGTASFSVPNASDGQVSVLGENRTLMMTGGSFTDSFNGYAVRLYEISPASG